MLLSHNSDANIPDGVAAVVAGVAAAVGCVATRPEV